MLSYPMTDPWDDCIPSLKLTVKAPENRPSQKETSIPTIHFQVRTVSFREGIYITLSLEVQDKTKNGI